MMGALLSTALAATGPGVDLGYEASSNDPFATFHGLRLGLSTELLPGWTLTGAAVTTLQPGPSLTRSITPPGGGWSLYPDKVLIRGRLSATSEFYPLSSQDGRLHARIGVRLGAGLVRTEHYWHPSDAYSSDIQRHLAPIFGVVGQLSHGAFVATATCEQMPYDEVLGAEVVLRKDVLFTGFSVGLRLGDAQ